MNFPFFLPRISEFEPATTNKTSGSTPEHSYVSDGCEFIDEGIRSKDQPLIVAKPIFPEQINRIL
jgi:hypothetical protein